MPNHPAFCTCLQLRQASRALTSMYDQALAPSGLRTTQFSLMASLQNRPTISQLGQTLLLEQSTITRNIKLLQKQGYVKLTFAPEDNRKKIIELTSLGKEKLKTALPLWQQAQREVARLMGSTPHARLLQDLRKLMARLKEHSVI